MTAEEKQKLKKLWVLLAAYYQRELLDEVVLMYTHDLEDLNFEDVRRAMNKLRSEKNRRTMPMPADVRAVLLPQIDPKNEAVELANGILGALVRHGYTWIDGYFSADGTYWEAMVEGKSQPFKNFDDAVAAELGPFATKVIKLMGGWLALHDEWAALKDHGTLRAQLRDLAQSVIEKESGVHRSEQLEHAPKLQIAKDE